MEFTSSTLQTSCSLPVRPPTVATRAPSICWVRSSAPSSLSSYSRIRDCRLVINPLRRRPPSFAAVVGDTTATRNYSSGGQELSVSGSSSPMPVQDEEDGVGGVDASNMVRICDKLIPVFMVDKPTPTDWRRLLVFSKEWSNIRPHFYKRCQERADMEDDPGMKHRLLRFGRRLKEIDEDVQRQDKLLQVIRESPDVSEVVAKRRKDFTNEFFVHLHTVAESHHNNPTEREALAKLGNMCLAAVQAYDGATESMEALNAAQLKFQDILNSPTLDVACKKIDDLAQKNQLDSALVLMISKAWSAAKETSMTKDEVKDVMYHLYKTATGNLQRLVPKEIRIVKYLLKIEDPEELLCALEDAFTPGEELEGTDVDSVYTTPENLHLMMKAVVDAYHFSGEGTLLRQARDLMNPKIVMKLEELMKIVKDKFM